MQEIQFSFWVKKIPWRRDGLPSPVSLGFAGGSDGKESTCNAGDLGSIPGLGRSSGEGYGNPLQYSCLEHPHGQRSLAGYSPWGCTESGMTKHSTEESINSHTLLVKSMAIPQLLTYQWENDVSLISSHLQKQRLDSLYNLQIRRSLFITFQWPFTESSPHPSSPNVIGTASHGPWDGNHGLVVGTGSPGQNCQGNSG